MVGISDWNDLQDVGNNLSTDYELLNDLDSSTAGYSGIGDSWSGDTIQGYTGVFDGQGNEIRDLVIQDAGVDDQGLFGSISDTGPSLAGSATIRNLRVSGTADYTTSSIINTGGLVGSLGNNGEVIDCIVDMDVSAAGDQAGVLAGGIQGGVSKCIAAGSCSGADTVGGLAGFCFIIDSDLYNISDSFSTVDVSGTDKVAGFIGEFGFAEISNCYSIGRVTTDGSIGGLVSDSVGDLVTGAFWDVFESQTRVSARGVPLSTTQMIGSRASDEMAEFDFNNVWSTVEDGESFSGTTAQRNSYPILQDLDQQKQLEMGALSPRIALDEWGLGDTEIGVTLEEERQYNSLVLEIRYEQSQQQLVETIVGGSDKIEILEKSSGGFRAIDTGTGASIVNLRAPSDRDSLRTVDEWLVDSYDREVADKDGNTYDLELELVPVTQKSFDNRFGTINSDFGEFRDSNEWSFDFQRGEIVTRNVSVDVTEGEDGTTSEYSLSTVLTNSEVRVLEENASHLNLVLTKDVINSDDVIIDDSQDGRNTVSVQSPDTVTEPISDGDYIIKNWESVWISGAYEVEFVLGET